MTRVNKPSVKITNGRDNSTSSGRSSALKMPNSSEATSRPLRVWYSMPLIRLAATITATALISQRCKKLFNAAGISFCRRPARQALSHFFQPFELVREQVFRGDSVARLPRTIVLLLIAGDLEPAEIERVGLLAAEFFRNDGLENCLRFICALVHQQRQSMIDLRRLGIGKPAEDLQRQ